MINNIKLLTFDYSCIESYTCIIFSICIKYYKYLVPWSGYFGIEYCSIKIVNYISIFTSPIVDGKIPSICFQLYSRKIIMKYIFLKENRTYKYLISYIIFSNIQSNIAFMIHSNQPAAFHGTIMYMRIIRWFECALIHIQPWFTFLVWNCCEVNVCRKSFVFKIMIRFESNVHPVSWDWYDFFIPIADRQFRFRTYIWTTQICYQYLISISINLLYWYVITIIMRIKLIKMKIFKNWTWQYDLSSVRDSHWFYLVGLVLKTS